MPITRPETSQEPSSKDAQLERISITPPTEAAQATPIKTEPAASVEEVKVVSPAQARFERILEQELSGTSFSYGVERKAIRSPDEALRVRQKLAPGRPQEELSPGRTKRNLKPLSKVRSASPSPFEGATVLDKLISFVAHVIKMLERAIFGGLRRMLQRKPVKSLVQTEPKEMLVRAPKKKAVSRWLRWSRM